MTIGKRIKERRLEIGMSADQLAERIGKDRATIYRYENGDIGNLPLNILETLGEVLGVSAAYLMGWVEKKEYDNYITVPVYGSIPAGTPLEAVENIAGEVDIPMAWVKDGGEYIALQVQGDSMYPKYLEGDVAIIKLQSDCESGQDCACYVNGYNASLKKVIKSERGVTLTPLNPNYAPKTYGNGNVEILGIVKEIRRKI